MHTSSISRGVFVPAARFFEILSYIIGANAISAKYEGDAPVIGNNVFIGAGTVILGAVRIGNNAIIGANAVVTSNVPEGKMAVGIPAVIK